MTNLTFTLPRPLAWAFLFALPLLAIIAGTVLSKTYPITAIYIASTLFFMLPPVIPLVIGAVRKHRNLLAITVLDMFSVLLVSPLMLTFYFLTPRQLPESILGGLIGMAIVGGPLLIGAIVWACTDNVEPKVDMDELTRGMTA